MEMQVYSEKPSLLHKSSTHEKTWAKYHQPPRSHVPITVIRILSNRGKMVEYQESASDESEVGTIDMPRNRANMYIRYSANGVITYPEFEDACSALIHRCHDEAFFGYFSMKWIGETGGHFLSISRSLSPNITEYQFASSPTHDVEDTVHFLSIEDDELSDEVAIHHGSSIQDSPRVEYHILYSPSYQVPVLYLYLHQLPPNALQGLDAIYQWLVPKEMENSLHCHGIVGGISIANHPVTDLPAYFIHPCNTAEAMKQMMDGRSILPLEYLQIWFGLVGSAVGLYLPKDIVIAS